MSRMVARDQNGDMIVIRNAQGRINPVTGMVELLMEDSPIMEYGAGQYLTKVLISALTYTTTIASILYAIAATYGNISSDTDILRFGLIAWSWFILIIFSLCIGDATILPFLGHVASCVLLFFIYKNMAEIDSYGLNQTTLLLIGFTIGIPTIVWMLIMAMMMGARYGTSKLARTKVKYTLFLMLIVASALIGTVLHLHNVDLVTMTFKSNTTTTIIQTQDGQNLVVTESAENTPLSIPSEKEDIEEPEMF